MEIANGAKSAPRTNVILRPAAVAASARIARLVHLPLVALVALLAGAIASPARANDTPPHPLPIPVHNPSCPNGAIHPGIRDPKTGINPWSISGALADMCELARSDIGNIRIDVPWQEVEPQPNVFAWTDLDAVVAQAQASRIGVLITLRSLSSWGTVVRAKSGDPYHGASPPLNIREWEGFVFSFAQRYKGRGVSYEIENEPNAGDFWRGTMQAYLQLLTASYSQIAAADPQARVVSGALACHAATTYPNASVQQKQDHDFDVWQNAILATHAYTAIGVHDYYFPDHAVNGWTFQSYLEHIEALARANKSAASPVWITETGFVSRPQKAGSRTDQGSPQIQGQWARAAFQQAFSAGAERVFWLFLEDHLTLGSNYFASMGIESADGRARPAYGVVSP